VSLGSPRGTDAEASDRLMTISEVAAHLHDSRGSVYKLMRDGELPWLSIGRARRVRRSDVEAFIAARIRGGRRLAG
jgi:excisionase family DNA binding protein